MRNRLALLIIVMAFISFGTGCEMTAHDYNMSGSHDSNRDIEQTPVSIKAFNIFASEMDNPQKQWFYIDWINNVEGKTIDGVDLRITGSFWKYSSEENIQSPEDKTIRLFEPDGVTTESHNQNSLLQRYDLMEEETYTAIITRVYFTDGSVMDGEGLSNPASAVMWGEKGEGKPPARLNEAVFWNETENKTDVSFQIDWVNQSQDREVFGVIYRFVGRNSDGTLAKDENGADAVMYYSAIEEMPVAPGSNNGNYSGKIRSYENDWCTRVRVFDVSIARVIDSTGCIWENPQAENDQVIRCIVTGIKGYAFGSYKDYPAIEKLIDQFNNSLNSNGLPCNPPLVYVRDREYCVLRYADFDVRVELTQQNTVSPDKVSVVCYHSRDYGQDDEQYKEFVKKVNDMQDGIRLALFPVVLTQIDPSEVVQRIEEYNSNNMSFIDFSDQSYDTFEDNIYILDEQQNELLMVISAAGKDLYYPSNVLLWTKEPRPPCEADKNRTVPHRIIWDYRYYYDSTEKKDLVIEAFSTKKQYGGVSGQDKVAEYHIPMVNLESIEISKINQQIYEKYEKSIQSSLNMISEVGYPERAYLRYKWHVYGNILCLQMESLVRIVDYVETVVFVFNISEKREMTKDEVLSAYGIKEDEYLELVRRALGSKCLDVIFKINDNNPDFRFDEWYAEYFKKTISDDNIIAASPFISERGHLCILGYYDTGLAFTESCLIDLETFQLSPYYEEMLNG